MTLRLYFMGRSPITPRTITIWKCLWQHFQNCFLPRRAFLGFFPSCTIKTDPMHRVHGAVRPDSVLRVPVRPRSAHPGKRRAVVAIIRAPVSVLTGTLSGGADSVNRPLKKPPVYRAIVLSSNPKCRFRSHE